MAKQVVTTKYGTKIDVTGLTPEQVKRVLSVAQDNGAYGAKGAALAVTLQKLDTKNAPPKNGTPAGSGGGDTPPPENDGVNNVTSNGADANNNLSINPKTGQDTNPAQTTKNITNAAANDTTQTFNMNNPGQQTDAAGDTQTITRDPTTGMTSVTKTGGAGFNAVNQAFTGAAQGFAANGQNFAQNAANANAAYISRNYAQQQAQETEAKKTELANRGIPISTDPNSEYAKEMKGVSDKWQTAYDQASQQGLATANQTMTTQAGVVNTLGNATATQNPTFTPYQGGQSTQAPNLQALLSTISADDLKKYGIDQDTMTKLAQVAAEKSIAAGNLSFAQSQANQANSGPVTGGTAP